MGYVCNVYTWSKNIGFLGVDRRDSISGYWIMDTLWESLQVSIHGRRAELGGIVRVEIFSFFPLSLLLRLCLSPGVRDGCIIIIISEAHQLE